MDMVHFSNCWVWIWPFDWIHTTSVVSRAYSHTKGSLKCVFFSDPCPIPCLKRGANCFNISLGNLADKGTNKPNTKQCNHPVRAEGVVLLFSNQCAVFSSLLFSALFVVSINSKYFSLFEFLAAS